MKIERFFVVRKASKNSTLNDVMFETNVIDFLNIIRGYKTHPVDDDIKLYTKESEALEDANKRLTKVKNISEQKRKPDKQKKIQELQLPKRGPGRPKKNKTQEPTIKTKTTNTSKSTKVPSHLNPVRAQIESEFMFHIPSYVIRSPGKFEGEMIYMPYYYGVYLEGGADDSGNAIKVEITKEDREIFPELPKNKKYIKFVITDQGFVEEV